VFIVSASGSQKPQFWANFDICIADSCTDPLLPMRAKFNALEQIRSVRLRAKFHLNRFILLPSGIEKPQFLPFFRLWHLVVSPFGSNLRKLNTGVQLQTFPYPMVSKSFLFSNAFMAKSGAQTVTFKSVTDRQTDKKLNVFGCPRRRVKSEPHQTWRGDRGPRACFCVRKLFRV